MKKWSKIIIIQLTLVVSSLSNDICTVDGDCPKKDQNLSGSVDLYSRGK